MIKKIVYYAAGFLLFLLVILWLNIDLSIFLEVKHFEFVMISLVLVFFIYLLLSLRLRAMLFSFGVTQTRLKELFNIELMSRLFLYIFPARLNVLAKAALLVKKYDLTKTNAFSITTFEQVLDFGSILIILLFAVLVFPFLFIGSFSFFTIGVIFAMCGILIILLFMFFKNEWFNALLEKAEKIRISIISKSLCFFIKLARDLRENWLLLAKSSDFVAILFYHFAYWLVSIVSLFVLFLAIGFYFENNVMAIVYIAVALSLAIFMGAVSTIPGGFGVRESVMVLVLSAFGIPPEITLFVVVTNRALVLIYVFVGYFIAIKLGYSDIGKIRNFISK